MQDKEIELLINKELQREKEYIDLIPSENYASLDVLIADGSVFTNKYAEGYPYKRYYPGTQYADEMEQLTIERAKKLFKCNFANVQALSGAVANLAIYNAFLKPYDRILAMDLNSGGHLSHGSKVSITGKIYDVFHYGVNEKTEELDYSKIRELALLVKPKLIVCGASNYSKIIDWAEFRKIADEVKAYLLADISHISALVVTGLHPDPIPYADFVMTTMQKQIRGARGAIILTNKEEYAKKIDASVFPGMQGGPQLNIIAGKAVCLYEAMQPAFKTYCERIIENAQTMCNVFLKNNFHVVANGTQNHLFCVDVFKKTGFTADIVEKWLQDAHILANKNEIPFDSNGPKTPSGIRMGSPAISTLGMGVKEAEEIANWVIEIINAHGDKQVIEKVSQKVHELLKKYPVYKQLNEIH